MDELCETMSVDEFHAHWDDYCTEPWGDWVLVNMIAQGSAMFANANRNSKKRPDPYDARDFLPGNGSRRDETDQRSEAEQIAEFESYLMGAV